MRRFAILAAIIAVSPAPAVGQQAAPNYCLVVNNARYPATPDKVISVEVDGYSGYWVLEPNETKTITGANADASESAQSQQILRGASFTLRVYEGRSGSRGALIAETTISGDGNVFSPRTISTPVAPSGTDEHTAAECRGTGYWNVLVHD